MSKPFQICDTTYMEKALNAATLRQQVISNNIANVNTDGYQAQTVNFEGQLREAMANDKAEDTDANPTAGCVDAEFAIGDAGGVNKQSLKPSVETVDGKMNIQNEMSGLAKNQIMYNAVATKISGIYGALKWVVENSGR